MENLTRTTAPTFESVWALMQETSRQMQETDRQRRENERILNEKFAETDRKMQETDRQMQETDRRMQETDRQIQETGRQIRNMQKELGGLGNSQGSFAEEYFFNSFENGKQNFFGEKFDEIEKNVKGVMQGLKDEFDIVMYNGTSVAIIEVKFRAREEHIPKLLRKADTFRIIFQYYKDFKIYLGLASMSFDEGVEKKCIESGIALIKQVGDTVVINDAHLKIW